MRQLLIALSLTMTLSASALESAKPLRAGGAEGLAPLDFGLTYSNRPRGAAFITSEQHPDIFVLVTVGMAGAPGFYMCSFDKIAADGSLVYKKPMKVKLLDDNPKTSSMFRVVQFDGNTYAMWMTTKKLTVAKWDNDTKAFVKSIESPVKGVANPLLSFDIALRGKRDLEIVMLCSDNAQYRPETFKGDTQSYYDGADIYRGALPRCGVFRVSFDARNWAQLTDVEQLSADMNVTIGGSEIATLRQSDKGLDGYLISNRLGGLKYIPRIDKKTPPYPVMHPMLTPKEILIHPTYSAKLIALPNAKGEASEFVIGGEGALYHYTYSGKQTPSGAPLFDAPKQIVQRNADLYGGSLVVPNVVDWDGDGALDIVAGNSEGRLLFYKNNGTDQKPDFAAPKPVEAAGVPILLRPGYHVVQGPFEASWGYLCPKVIDWNGDGLLDVVTSGSRAKYEVMLNRGTKTQPRLDNPVAIKCDNLELWGTWRVRPAIATIDGRNHMVIMDDKNSLHLYRQVDDYNVEDTGQLRLTNGNIITGHNNLQESLGQLGRGKLSFVDWDNDGRLDLLIGSIKRSSYPSPERGLPCSRFKKKKVGMQVMLLRNVGSNSNMRFEEPVQFQVNGKDFYLGAHSNAPEPCALGDTSGGINLLVGVESGKFFFFNHKELTTVGIDD